MRLWIYAASLASALAAAGSTNDWPMLAHDAGRSGAAPREILPPFTRQWYRLFTDEGLMSGVQPVISESRVFLGTLRGIFRALDAETGKDIWAFRAGGAILHAAAVGDGKVFFGSADGTIYAVNVSDGAPAWEVDTGAAVWNAPAFHQGTLFIGGRDQQLYALEARTGNIRWRAATDGPLLNSPAVDAARGRVYVGGEDMRVYAFALADGREVWRSEQLPGVSLRGYHPVIAPDGSVLVTAAPGVSVDTFQGLLLEMVKEVFGDFASWRHSREVNAILRDENFALMEKPETYAAQLNFIRQRLKETPSFQTFFVLHPDNGRQKFIAPIVYSESMNGPGAPPLVAPDGRVIVKYQALLRSRYEHYSPFLNVGQLNTATGDIQPLMDQSRVYGWFDSLLLVHDEQSQLTLAGPILINTHQDNVNGLDLATGVGFPEPLCRNIHEPKRGEALAIWARLLRGEPLPPGKEWLARGTAVYGGGSVLDTAVAVAGDRFYYLPTHELNAGAALIAYRMDPWGMASEETALLPETLTEEEWRQVQNRPWDWDTLEFRRLDHLLDALPGGVPGTRRNPLTNEAVQAAAITEADLDRIIWESAAPAAQPSTDLYLRGLRQDLAQAVRELIAQPWQPLLFPAGKFPEETYRFFTEPTETLATLALAYPHLDADLQRDLRAHVARLAAPGGPLDGPVGQRTYPAGVGQRRSWYQPPPEQLLKLQEDVLRSDLARLYPLWAWAQVSGDWNKVRRDWPRLTALVHQRPNRMEEDCRNGYIAGLIAYCRLAHRMEDEAAVRSGVAAAKTALRERLLFEFSHPHGGLIWQVPRMRAAFSRWHFLTPEVGRMLGQRTRTIQASLMERYVDYHRPTWWLAWNVETVMRNECPYEFPTLSADIFAARALVLNEPAGRMARFIDRPWCRADEYYIRKLALTLQAAYPSLWTDVRQRSADTSGKKSSNS